MVGEECVILVECGMISNEHLPEAAKLLHVLRVIGQVFLPENLQCAVDPGMLLLRLLLVWVQLIERIQVRNDDLDDLSAEEQHLLILMIDVFVLVP